MWLLLGCLWPALLLTAPHALAASSSREAAFGLVPVSAASGRSYFVFRSRPGATFTGAVRVTNVGNASGTALLYPVDATTGQTSGTVLLQEQAPRVDAGAWISLEESSVTLAPGQSRVVPFRVTVPRGVRPGQHVGGIVAENEAVSTQPSQAVPGTAARVQVNIRHLTGLAVEVILPGRMVQRLKITGVSAGGENGYQRLFVALRNAGRVIVKPSGIFVVTDDQGTTVQMFQLSLDSILPKTRIQYPVLVQGQALPAGTYHAFIKLNYGHGHVVRYSGTFGITATQIAQVFGGASAPLSPPASDGSSRLAGSLAVKLLLVGFVVGGGGFLAVVVWRRRPARAWLGDLGWGSPDRLSRASRPRSPKKPSRARHASLSILGKKHSRQDTRDTDKPADAGRSQWA